MTTKEVRDAIYARQHGYCLWCDMFVTKEQAHMHEVVPRGKGGEISLENSIILCFECHEGPHGAHGNRLPKFKNKT